MTKNPSILVTGAAGRIGSTVVTALSKWTDQVYGFDRVEKEPSPFFVQGDLKDASTVNDAVRGKDVVIHLGATPDDADFMTELLPNNIIGAYNVLEACRLHGVRRLILASSGQVIAARVRGEGPWPVRVDEPLKPYYLYAATKIFAESVGQVFANRHGFDVLVVRLGWCPRSAEHLAEWKSEPLLRDVYFSPSDIGRFFTKAVQKSESFGFKVVFACSRPFKTERYDLKPAEELLGFRPKDLFPDGLEHWLNPEDGDPRA